MTDEKIRRDESLLYGRLVALPSTITRDHLINLDKESGKFRNIISIDFPAMPESIELSRDAEYLSTYGFILPDGVHQYKATRPLEIPISFKLHAMDRQYCKKGALTLLQLAARLHSFVLPISTFRRGIVVAPKVKDQVSPANANTNPDNQENTQTGVPNENVVLNNASSETIYEVVQTNATGTGGVYGPVTCWLHLMWVNNNQPGISCIGYVRSVRVRFNGPWLRGPNDSFNLPSSADYEFTFVHCPAYNNVGLSSRGITSTDFLPVMAESLNAYADDVKTTFYNTRDLIGLANFQGFRTNPTHESR